MKIVYGSTDSPFGEIFLAVSNSEVVRMCLKPKKEKPLLEMRGQLPDAVIEEDKGRCREMNNLKREVEAYFNGRLTEWKSVPNLLLVDGFYKKVLNICAKIGYGETVSYGELAARAGSPRAARAVGTSMSSNTVPLIVPCHRVIKSDGSTGYYGGGADMKKSLLEMEKLVLGKSARRVA